MLYEIDTTKIGNIADMEIGLSRFVERKYCRGKENDEFKTLLKNHKINMEETLENSIREGQLLDLITFNKMIIEHDMLGTDCTSHHYLNGCLRISYYFGSCFKCRPIDCMTFHSF